MSLERKPAGRPAPDAAPPRTLTPASNPALRLQELLRRESQMGRAAEPTLEPPAAEAPAPTPTPVQEMTVQDVIPSPPSPAAPRSEEPVTLIVVVNSERSTPQEYLSREEMPTVGSLEQSHKAFLLSDEWQRRGTVMTRIIRLRRRRR